LMSVIEGARSAPAYPELAGKRVLITGLSSSCEMINDQCRMTKEESLQDHSGFIFIPRP